MRNPRPRGAAFASSICACGQKTAWADAVPEATGAFALYPSFRHELIMWPGRAFNEPALPPEPDSIVTATTAEQLAAALSAGGVEILIPSGTAIGEVVVPDDGRDAEIVIEAGASISSFQVLDGLSSRRIRIRGPGKIGIIGIVNAGDIVVDGVVLDPARVNPGYGGPMAYLYDARRTAFLNCVGRSDEGPRPCFFINESTAVFFAANCNFAVDPDLTANDKWVVRLNNGNVSPERAMRRILFVDCVMQTYTQGFRLSSEGQGCLIDGVMLYRCALVNTENAGNIIHSQDLAPVTSNCIYLRECSTVMARGELWAFGGRPDVDEGDSRVEDGLWHIVDHVYRADSSTRVDAAILQDIMDRGAVRGWDLQYLGTAADPRSLYGASFEYDLDIAEHWRADASADSSWPEIRSPLVGDGVVVGRNPHTIP